MDSKPKFILFDSEIHIFLINTIGNIQIFWLCYWTYVIGGRPFIAQDVQKADGNDSVKTRGTVQIYAPSSCGSRNSMNNNKGSHSSSLKCSMNIKIPGCSR